MAKRVLESGPDAELAHFRRRERRGCPSARRSRRPSVRPRRSAGSGPASARIPATRSARFRASLRPDTRPPAIAPPGYAPPLPAQPLQQARRRRDRRALRDSPSPTASAWAFGLSASSVSTIRGLFLIPPAILGIAAPVGVYFLDDPSMDGGMPAAMAAGAAIGAGEGIGIASYQFVSTEEEDAWGSAGSRARPRSARRRRRRRLRLRLLPGAPARSSLFVSSGVLFGTAIGSMFGYGASEAGVGYGNANDSAGLSAV